MSASPGIASRTVVPVSYLRPAVFLFALAEGAGAIQMAS